MSDNPAFTDIELELHAFVDGELSPERHAKIAALVDRDPELQRQVQELRELNEAIGRLADPLLAMPVPERLTQGALRRPGDAVALEGRRPPTRRSARWKAAGVAIALAASITVGVFVTHDRRHREVGAIADPVVAEALAARDGEQAPVRKVSFTSDADSGARDRFVSEALGNALRAPDLRRAGYTLVGADLYGGAKGRAIQLRYMDQDRHLFTVYVHPGAAPNRFSLLQHNSIGICVWQNEDMSTVMSAELPTSELFRLSSMTYSALAL